MENNQRVTMCIPFSEYLKKIAEKNNQGGGMSPYNYKGVKPSCVIGDMYPDLYSQASYINKDIDEAKSKMSEAIKDLFDIAGEDFINMVIDSISHYLIFVFQELDEEDNKFSKRELFNIQSDVFCRGELAKTLLALYQRNERLKELKERAELTQKNILL